MLAWFLCSSTDFRLRKLHDLRVKKNLVVHFSLMNSVSLWSFGLQKDHLKKRLESHHFDSGGSPGISRFSV